jgi:type IV pilus assembly protein PilY1
VPRGQLCPDAWNAATLLNAMTPAARTILSYNGTARSGIAFRWDALSAAQQGLLNRNPNLLPTQTADTRGSARLDYLRGDSSQEGAGNLRPRGGLLGDIVASDPVYVGAPSAALPFSGYSGFAATYAGRTPVIYVGANDGMLHGFRESDGAEVLAYVPAKLFGTYADPRLARLTAQPYTHVYGVDGSPSVADVQVDGHWASYLVGALRYGGQGLFALDVTDPAQFSEANAASMVKWEFTDADDPDLGYSFSQPSIVRLHDGRWAAIVGNGYNSKEADGAASAGGRAALFVIFLEGPGADGVWAEGSEYLKIPVGPSGSGVDNGLATPAVIDLDGDRVADYAFAGDLLGNLWQFNLRAGDPDAWVAGNGGEALFIARSGSDAVQPITSAPEVGLNLLTPQRDDLVVYFGTGKYIEVGDNSQANQQNQSFYGVFADPVASETETPTRPTRANLLRQTVLQEQTLGNGNLVRLSSQNAIDLSSHKGWYIDLYNTATAGLDPTPASGLNKGERQISRPLLRDGRIVFTTLIPSDQPCEFGGSGWLMELDARTGARPAKPALDITQNLTVDSNDVVTLTEGGSSTTVPVSGIASLTGTLSTPAVLALSATQEAKYSVRSDGSTAVFGEAASGRLGRITWREIMR